MIRKALLSAAFFLLTFLYSVAQSNKVEMADTMRSNGKIYVVIAVILTIFAGIIIYLIRLDKKITSLEKDLT
ncbi:MAG TPA: CcmD family protein [Chitinophagaceae bacterium]|nr:CcmD family protein [Chitinophagaceae bacterium]